MEVESRRKIGVYIDFENFYNSIVEFLALDKRILISKKVKNEGVIFFNHVERIEKNFITDFERLVLKETIKSFINLLKREGRISYIKAFGIFSNLPFNDKLGVINNRNIDLRKFINNLTIKPITPFENATGKNASDIRLTIEVLTDLGIHKKNTIDSVFFITGDSDLFPLYIWANENSDKDIFILSLLNRISNVYVENSFFQSKGNINLITILINRFLNLNKIIENTPLIILDDYVFLSFLSSAVKVLDKSLKNRIKVEFPYFEYFWLKKVIKNFEYILGNINYDDLSNNNIEDFIENQLTESYIKELIDSIYDNYGIDNIDTHLGSIKKYLTNFIKNLSKISVNFEKNIDSLTNTYNINKDLTSKSYRAIYDYILNSNEDTIWSKDLYTIIKSSNIDNHTAQGLILSLITDENFLKELKNRNYVIEIAELNLNESIPVKFKISKKGG